MKGRLAIPVLIASGAAPALAAPPLGWTFLHVFGWVPGLWVMSQLAGRRAFLAGWLAGATMHAAGFYWIADTVGRFSSVPTPLAYVLLALWAAASGLYFGVFAWGFGPIRRAAGPAWPVAIAAWFTALEFLSPQLFTYAQGAVWYQLPEIFLVASLTGVSGVTFLVFLGNAVGLQALEAARRAAPGGWRAFAANALALGLLLAAAAGWSAARLARIERAEAAAKPVRVALVQPNYDVAKRRAMRGMAPDVFARDLVALSGEAERLFGGVDVFVWPEGALTREPGDPRNRAVLDFVRATGAEVWTGANDYRLGEDGRRHSYNSAFRIFDDGEIGARYDKNILVPFGEFMPFADVLPALRNIRGPGNFARGDGLSVHASDLARFAFLICYEAIQPGYVRQGVRRGPELLVNLTFDAWFGDTSEPYQHLMLTAVQSAQYGVPLLRATTTGISAIVDARGRIVASTGVYTREVVVRDVKPLRVPSLYARAGDWFAWSCAGVSAILLLVGRRRRPPGPAPEPGD